MSTEDQTANKPRCYRIRVVTKRWVLRESKARWLVRSIPTRDGQSVTYRSLPFGYQLEIVDRYYEDPPEWRTFMHAHPLLPVDAAHSARPSN